MKSLRSKKSEDVIFSGTDKLARVGLAEVSLYLNNEDRQAPIDFSQLVITRRLYRSGESEYLLNRNQVRLQDIILLLAQASFGQKTYSIIGQGMVDAILTASPFERKEFFDEAAGTRHLYLKREDALRKLEQTEDNLSQAESLVQEIVPRLRSLVRQVKRLERRDEVAAELKALQEQYYGAARTELERDLKTETVQLDQAVRAREAAERALQEMQERFATMERAVSPAEEFTTLSAVHRTLWEAKGKLQERVFKLKTELAKLAVPRAQTALSPSALLPYVLELEASVATLLKLLEPPSAALDLAALRAVGNSLHNHLQSLQREVAGTAPASIDQGSIEQELRKIVEEEHGLEGKLREAEAAMQEFQERAGEKNKTFFSLQHTMQEQQEKTTKLLHVANEHRVALARLTANRESLEATIQAELGSAPLLPALVAPLHEREELKRTIDQLKTRVAEIGSIDPETVAEYKTTQERHEFLTSQSEDLHKSIQDFRSIVAELDETIAHQFNESFQKINREFEHFFKVLFGGGHAKLVKIVDTPTLASADEIEGGDEDNEEPDDASSSRSTAERLGIEIHATPPGKRLKNINMLSGGERALTSLALICSILANNPSPFVVLDEVDAALDEANSARLAEIIDQLSHRTQFIVITHNRAMMHQSNILYGVTMGDDGASKVLSLKLEEIVKE